MDRAKIIYPIFTITYFYKRHVFLLFGCGGRTIDGNLFMVGAVNNEGVVVNFV